MHIFFCAAYNFASTKTLRPRPSGKCGTAHYIVFTINTSDARQDELNCCELINQRMLIKMVICFLINVFLPSMKSGFELLVCKYLYGALLDGEKTYLLVEGESPAPLSFDKFIVGCPLLLGECSLISLRLCKTIPETFQN